MSGNNLINSILNIMQSTACYTVIALTLKDLIKMTLKNKDI